MKPGSLRILWSTGYARPFVVLAALNLLVAAAFTLPRSVQEQRLSVRATDLREGIGEVNDQATLAHLQVDVVKKNIDETHRLYTEVLKPRTELPEVLEELNKMGSDLGLRITRASYRQESVKGSALLAVEISMPVSGTYQQITAFMRQVERSPAFVVIENVGMKNRVSDGGVDLDMRLVAYFRQDKVDKPGKGSPS